MKHHLEEDDLILHFYGEAGTAIEPHLDTCPECRNRYQALQRVLNSVDIGPVPYRAAEYEEEVWNRLAPKLGHRNGWRDWFATRRIIPVMAALTLVVFAFFAGRYSPKFSEPIVAHDAENGQVRERVLVVAVGGHLERSKMLLVEIANADPDRKIELGEDRELAKDLVYDNRLYRQTAMSAGEGRMAGLLEELERVLIEIAHSPEELGGTRLQNLRERIKSEGLIFKIRVAGSKLAQGETL